MNRRPTAGVFAAVAAAAVVLAACSPSEQDSDQPPGSEPDLRISAPSSAPAADPGGQECAIDDFTVAGQSGRQPKLTLPKDCTPPAAPLSKTLDKGEGPAAKTGDTVDVNYYVQGMDSRTVYKSWESATETQSEQVQVGGGDVLPGWDEALVGMTAGSRKLLVLPPEQGAAEADEQLGFEPDETLVLVIGITRVG